MIDFAPDGKQIDAGTPEGQRGQTFRFARYPAECITSGLPVMRLTSGGAKPYQPAAT